MIIENRSGVFFGLVLLIVGVAIVIGASTIQTGFSYDAVGPAVFPMIIGGGFFVAAILVIVESVIVKQENEVGNVSTDFKPVLAISAALLAEAFLIGTLGWVPMAGLLFAAGTWAFGDRRLALNVIIGLIFAALILAVFSFALGLDLPLGIFEPLFSEAQ